MTLLYEIFAMYGLEVVYTRLYIYMWMGWGNKFNGIGIVLCGSNSMRNARKTEEDKQTYVFLVKALYDMNGAKLTFFCLML